MRADRDWSDRQPVEEYSLVPDQFVAIPALMVLMLLLAL
jgi:hypothetical protein